LLLALTTIIFGSCARTTVQVVSGKVVKIADGDTITVLNVNEVEHRLRLLGIDAPERKQGFSQTSRQHLASLIFGKWVTVQYRKRDRYGRIVGKVLLDGQDECVEQLKVGLAWHYGQFENEQS
jgi:endonuclease YncB( thermonuclease family)